MPLSPGSNLGPYEVLALIGEGGMGEVYRARDPRLGREVAIRVLPHDHLPVVFFPGTRGIYYLECGEASDSLVQLLNPHTGSDEVLGKLERWENPFYCLPVSRDGSLICYTRTSIEQADLMFVENFK